MREKKALIKEAAEAQRLLQEKPSDNLEDVTCLQLAIGKVLLNLEAKFSRMESANDKVIDAFEQNNDADGAEQFQQVLDEDAELMDNVVSRISELKVMKEKLERVCKNLKAQSSHTQAPPLDTSGVNIANIWSQSIHSPIRLLQLDIHKMARVLGPV